MALTLACDTTKAVTIEAYVDHIRTLDLADLDALADSAPMLRALANDRTLVVRKLNQQVEDTFRKPGLASAQTIYLGGEEDFYVRAAIWPSSAAVAGARLYQDKFAYHLAHDHNFTFLTVNYLGPGYETAIYEYDYESVKGFPGEAVDLRFLEKLRFGQNVVMLYRASRDVHIQYPPEELTITLNLMVSPPEIRLRDQFYFDIGRRQISDYAPDTDASQRANLMKLAAALGDETTEGLLRELALHHTCRRTRLAAFEALCQRRPTEAAGTWETACRDPAPLIVSTARRRLELLRTSELMP